MSYFLFSSMGNDSIALIAYMRERLVDDCVVHVVYTNTGWASDEWPARVALAKQKIGNIGFKFVEIHSEGMESLVMRKKGWPMPASKFQFCTQELKVKPALAYMDTIDPAKDWVCLNGIRREESSNRSQAPEYLESSERHGGRSLWSPLVHTKEQERNLLIYSLGMEVLSHRSRECYPCVSGKRETLRTLPEEKLVQIEGIEERMGFTRKGKPRTMFRPYRHMGATGIRAVKDWADSEPGKYGSIYDDAQMCLGGWCES